MRNRIARAFAVLCCGCLLLSSCELDSISVETVEVGDKLASAAAGVTAAAVVNFDKVVEKAEEQGLLHIDADAERKLQDASAAILDLSADAQLASAESEIVETEPDISEEDQADTQETVEKTMENETALSEQDEKEESESAVSDDPSGNDDEIVENSEDSKDSKNSEKNEKSEKSKKHKDKSEKTYGYKHIGIANVHTSLNVREKASKASRRIGSMKPDAACEIKGYEGDWAKIKSGDVTGFVMASYLLTDEEAEQRAELLMSDSVTVNADVLRVRENASINSRIITRVKGGTKLVLADAGEPGAESAQISEEKQERSGAPPGKEDGDSTAKTVEKKANSDDFASVKVKDSIEVAKNEINSAPKAPPDGDAAFEDTKDVRAADEIGDNGWVEIELGNGRFGYVSTDYVEVSTELTTASALYAPDPIEEKAPAVTVADVAVAENVTVAAEQVEDVVSADSGESTEIDDGIEDDPGGGASEDDSGIAEAPETDDEVDGGEAEVTDPADADAGSSDDGSELAQDEQTTEEETENTEEIIEEETGGDSDAAEEPAEEVSVPEESEQTAPVAPIESTGTDDPATFAMRFLGNPYVWGGSSLTNGADCSGFVMSVYANYGIALPHSSAAQAAYGTRISAAEAVPGDLFFYGSGTINHVGIYVGNGQIIHASNKRTGIKLSSAYYQPPVCVTRLVN